MGQFYGGPSVDAIPTFAGPLISTHGPTNDVTKLVAYPDVGYDLRTDHASYEPVAVSERRRIDTRTVSIEAPRTMCGVKASQGRTFMAKLNINGRIRDVQVEADTPLLWVIREQVGLTGTKYGCGVAQCGACSVHINGALVRSCVTPRGKRESDRPDRHHRRPVGHQFASRAEGLGAARRAAVRLLSVRADHGRGGPAEEEPEAD